MNRALKSPDPDIRAFARDLETQRRSAHTVKNYTLQANKLREWLAKERGDPAALLREATEADLKQYQVRLVSQEQLSKNTLYITIKAIQAFYRFIERDVADRLRPPRRSQSLPKYLTETEARRLLEAAQSNARDHIIIQLLLYSGLRVGELTRLAITDIDFHERTLRVRSGKGDKDRLVIVAPHVADGLRRWIEARPGAGGDHLFPGQGPHRPVTPMTVQRMVASAARRAEIAKHVTPHVLRHTFATTLLRRGGDIRFIQKILGHASIATTQVYTHLDDAELKRMYDRAQPNY